MEHSQIVDVDNGWHTCTSGVILLMRDKGNSVSYILYEKVMTINVPGPRFLALVGLLALGLLGGFNNPDSCCLSFPCGDDKVSYCIKNIMQDNCHGISNIIMCVKIQLGHIPKLIQQTFSAVYIPEDSASSANEWKEDTT